MPMKPIVNLKPGDTVRTRRTLVPQQIKYWSYAAQCDSIGGGLMAGTTLEIAETNAGQRWVRLKIPGRSPDAFLKVSGEELQGAFDLV